MQSLLQACGWELLIHCPNSLDIPTFFLMVEPFWGHFESSDAINIAVTSLHSLSTGDDNTAVNYLLQ
jgi:hypothetical protein